MSLPTLAISQISDRYSQENFQQLQDYLRTESVFLGFKFFEVSFTSTADHYKFKHNLGFLPKDVLITSQIGSGSLAVNSSLATADSLDFTISGTVTKDNPLTVRFLAGTFNTGA